MRNLIIYGRFFTGGKTIAEPFLSLPGAGMSMSQSFSELESLVLLNRLSIGGGREVLSLLRDLVPAVEIVEKIQLENLFEKRDALNELLKQFSPEREIEQCQGKGIRLMTFRDSDYPPLLASISDPPILLYIQGSLLETDQAAIALVGSRLPSFYGLSQAKRFASELAARGLTIVSGLARGIDQAAHQGALTVSYGRTVGVLGCGLDVDYPPRRGALSEKIIAQGALISEYPLGTSPRAENFPRRNRIISGLSLGVLVVEARERSGSLITAHEAVDQGREVFAIPGPVDQPTSRGAHLLLREGAFLTESPQDVLENLSSVLWPFVTTKGRSECPAEKEPLDSLSLLEKDLISALSAGALGSDQLAGRLQQNAPTVLSALTRLELKGQVQKRADGFFFKAK